MKMSPKHQKAIKALESFVKEHCNDHRFNDVKIHTFYDDDGGLRINEIELSNGRASLSWQRYNIDSASIILNAEEYLICLPEDKPFAEDRLRIALEI